MYTEATRSGMGEHTLDKVNNTDKSNLKRKPASLMCLIDANSISYNHIPVIPPDVGAHQYWRCKEFGGGFILVLWENGVAHTGA